MKMDLAVENLEDLDTAALRISELPHATTIEINIADAGPAVIGELLVLRRQWISMRHKVTIKGRSSCFDCAMQAIKSKPWPYRSVNDCGDAVLCFTGTNHEGFDNEVQRYLLNISSIISKTHIPDQARKRLLGSLGEMIDNVKEHSDGAPSAIAAVQSTPDYLSMVVADTGRGVLAGYRDSYGAEYVRDAHEALELAVVQHKSRYNEPGRGNGFRELMNSLHSLDARLRVRSDNACIETDDKTADPCQLVLREKTLLRGFVVSALVQVRPNVLQT